VIMTMRYDAQVLLLYAAPFNEPQSLRLLPLACQFIISEMENSKCIIIDLRMSMCV
jgi:hypothetical protein